MLRRAARPLLKADATGTVRQRLGLASYLARMEFSRRYSGTVGGWLWMFLGPLLTIFTIWIALDVGLSATGRFGSQFGATFAVGLAAWLLFAEVAATATASIRSNPHLVKKVVFPVAVLPLSMTMAAFAVHVFVLAAVAAVLFAVNGSLALRPLHLLFWMAALFSFSAVVGLFLATLNVRFHDVGVVVPNVVSLAFWLTPIVWPMSQIPPGWRAVVMLNPMATIIEGYRGALGGGGIAIAPLNVLIFLLTMMAVAALAAGAYRRYRTTFADHM